MPRTRPGVGALLLMAGKGTRFRSELPKVLHPILGQPMGAYALQATIAAGIGTRVLVVGHQADAVKAAFPAERTALQTEQRGTGHAVKVGLKALAKDCSTVIVINGDSPLLQVATLDTLLKQHKRTKAACTVVVTIPDDPTGLGRVLLDERDQVLGIVEEKDCTPEQRLVTTVNTGCYAFDRVLLEKMLKKLATGNAQGEEYLTDVPRLLMEAGHRVLACHDQDSFAIMPNNRAELAIAAAELQYRILDQHFAAGVSFPQPDLVYIEPSVSIDPDATIWGGSYLRGSTHIGTGAVIGPGSDLTDARVGAGCRIRQSVIEDATLGPGTTVGPFAHLRGGASIGAKVRIGNFVEIKKSQLGDGAKAPHLSYIGDATVGERSNIGAGTITCNYDGIAKHPTTIGQDVFIGSDSILVAPVVIGDGSQTAAGSVITQDVPPGHIAFGRARQENKPPKVLNAIRHRQRGPKKGPLS